MMRLNRMELGADLKAARRAHGFSVREVEAQTGITRSVISRAERGHPDGYVTADAVIVLSRFFNLDARGNVEVFHKNTPSGQTEREVA
ncbi:helix-turn-helix transcriptional regulator [Roseibium sp.]|uniref:helix-turn-helix domain-containing protein n=1 Tax=Roseibium sp. TaxID=1936156 RepID=UPI00329A11C4